MFLFLLLHAAAFCSFFFFNDTATTEIYTLSLHDALPICERLHRGIRRHAFLRSVAAKLSAYEAVRGEGGDRLEDLHLLVADGFAVWPDRRLHRQVAQDLEQMILDDVAHGARLVVGHAPALNSELFGHRDLHALDVIAVPERLKEGVRK